MSIGSHQTSIGKDQSRFTPRWLWEPVGPFPTDACAGDPRPWDIGTERNITAHDDSLSMDWRLFGKTWCNPPFHRYRVGAFVARMCAHGDGILMLHVRPETAWFRPIFQAAAALLFLDRRVIFCQADGSPCTIENPEAKHYGEKANSGAPVVLVAFGLANAETLADFDLGNNPTATLRGNFLPIMISRGVLVAALDTTWRKAVLDWLRAQDGPVSVGDIWRAFMTHPKARGRAFAREQIRKVLQLGAGARVGPDQWVAAS